MKILKLLIAPLCLLITSGETKAAAVGFRFGGTAFTDFELFGVSFPAFTPYSGHAVYESSSAPTHSPLGCVDCRGYRQDRSNGLLLRIGDLTVRADSYVVTAVNDRPGLGGESNDVLVFDSNGELDPPLSSGLYVNGEPAEGGSLRLNLNAHSSFLVNPELPSDPGLGGFHIGLCGVSAGTNGGPDQLDFFGLLSSLSRYGIISGDYDQDGVVTAADYSAWRYSYGTHADLTADGNGDGRVDAADYTIWRDNLSAPGVSTAPEPATMWGVLLVVLALDISNRRRPVCLQVRQ